MKNKLIYPVLVLLGMTIFSIKSEATNLETANSEMTNSETMGSDTKNSETTSTETLNSESNESEIIDSGSTNTETTDTGFSNSETMGSETKESEMVTEIKNDNDIENIANTLFLLAFNRDVGQLLWNQFGMDWSAPMSDDPKYLEDLNWYRDIDKEEYVLENGNNAYYLANSDSKKTVILAHGYRGDALQMGPWARIYYDLGYNILSPDASGHGTSPGETIDFGWLEKENYLQWINLINDKNGMDSEIILHGVSMGAATVLMTAGEELPANVMGVIADSAYTSVMDEMMFLKGIVPDDLPGFSEDNVNAAVPLLNDIVKSNLGFDMNEASVVKQVQNSKVPIALIHSVDDDFIPHSFEGTIFENISSENKYQWTAAGGKHISGIYYDRLAYKHMIETYIALFSNGKQVVDPVEMIFSFVDEGGNELADRLTFHGREGDKVELAIPTIENYICKENIENGYTFGSEDTFITIVYQQDVVLENPGNEIVTEDSLLKDSSSVDENLNDKIDSENLSIKKNNEANGTSQKKYPQTGETNNKVMFIVGSICLASVLLVIEKRVLCKFKL